MNIDEEWELFISLSKNENLNETEHIVKISKQTTEEFISSNLTSELNCNEAPKSSPIYISTKTKIAYLNMPIDLNYIFWEIPIISYGEPTKGVIKKQIKFNSNSLSEYLFIQNKLQSYKYYYEHVITNINNPDGRIKFKDVRKISIGICKKDLTTYRCKQKGAFYNCFALIFRIKVDEFFKEFHVKVFNTGKIEIPGVQCETNFNTILKEVIETLQPYFKEPLKYKDNYENILINSNFNCGFFLNREILNNILKFKYNIQTLYDPCSYPGIQCKFYYNPDSLLQNGCQISEINKHLYNNINEVSFMIFRTGSVLIVGRCDENVLLVIYEYLKVIFINEYKNIVQTNTKHDIHKKTKKTRRKNILIEVTNII